MAGESEKIISKHRDECSGSLTAFKRDLQKIRTGRASSSLIEGVSVDYYGKKTPIGHLGQISTPEPRLIVIQVYDQGAIQSVEKALQSSGLGLNPSREGNVLRIAVPTLTEESRKDIVKMLHKMAEDIRVSIRNHRREANDQLKALEKDSVLTKDESKRSQDRVQKQTDSSISEVDSLLKGKEAEVLEV